MSRLAILKMTGTVVIVAAALTYGAGQAVAGVEQMTCTYDPPAFLGDCPSGGTPECDALCETVGGDGWGGYCTGAGGSGGCCVCFL